MSEDKTPSARQRGALQWWESLNGQGADPRPDPGALARLRRETSPVRAWGDPAVAGLYRSLRFTREDRDRRMEAVAVLAMILAHVREDIGDDLGAALGPPPPKASGDKPAAVMHPLRARRLTSARDVEETLRGFREAVSLLGGKAPVEDLARYTLDWLDPSRGDSARSRFLFAYHGAAFAAPRDDESNETSDPKESTL